MLLFAALQAGPAHALRCDGRVIEPPMTAAQVESLCGEPDLRDDWLNGYGNTVQEQWYYNFGPRRLLYILTLRYGRLVKTETDGYGFVESAVEGRRCLPADIFPGMNKLNLLHTCGEPEQLNVWMGYQLHDPVHDNFRTGPSIFLKREEWFYNFGPRRLRREIVLENGRISHIRSHGYGD